MDQHYLWKSQPSEETYTAPAHDILLRDRFDNSQLRLDPSTIKHGLSSEADRNPQSGLNKPMGNIEHLGDMSSDMPLEPNMDRASEVGGTSGNPGRSAGHSAEVSVQTPAEGAPNPPHVGRVPGNNALGIGASGNVAPGNVVKTPGSNTRTTSEASEVSEGSRRVVSTKRAAQNRNSQNAFRKRRQKYIEELESTAEKVKVMEKTIDDLRSENMELREFSLALQTRLMELERESAT